MGGVPDSVSDPAGCRRQKRAVCANWKKDGRCNISGWRRNRDPKVANLVNLRHMDRIMTSPGKLQYHLDRSQVRFIWGFPCLRALLVCMHEPESRQRGYFSTGQEWFSSPVKEHHSWVKALGISERGLQWPPREKLEVTAVFMCRPVIVLWTNCLHRYGFIATANPASLNGCHCMVRAKPTKAPPPLPPFHTQIS